MAKRLDCGLRGTIQSEQNNHAFRLRENNTNLTQSSIDNGNHYLRRMSDSVDLRFSTIRKNEFRNANSLFDEQLGTLGRKFYNNTTESEVAPECNILQGYVGTSGDGRVSSLPYGCERSSNRIKIQNADINAGIGSGVCPNQRTIEILQSSFGKLRRIGTFAGYEWTTELLSRTCQFVYANPCESNCDQGSLLQMPVYDGTNDSISSCNNRRILVDTFESKSDRHNIATSIGCNQLTDEDPKNLTFYISDVAEFYFDHIIIIGEVNYAMLFLDCFGRVFLWESESQLLYPLRDSLKAP
ncbi:unnamed protein product [Rhizophagus irregularis]|nr:unnamed protein product [Rhizophagus irregularis]